MKDSTEILIERYRRSRDYSLLFATPEFQRFIEEVHTNQDKTLKSLATIPSDTEHDKLVEIRYFNSIIGSLQKVSSQLENLKEQLDSKDIKYT